MLETLLTDTPVVEIENLSRHFRRGTALDDVSLTIERGGVHGLVGENGAGKTTLIKHLLGLFKAKAGTVRVFGLDPVLEPEAVLGRIGYLSEDRDLPGWMRICDLMRYSAAFYPAWDPAYAEHLRDLFELDHLAKVKHLSRGELAKAGLLVALAHRPEFLVLDEPSSGLDPIVRRDILAAVIRTVADEGRTVLFSSHLLEEVERVADRVTMISRGKRVLNASMEDVKESHHRYVVRAENGTTVLPALPGLLWSDGAAPEWTVLCTEGSEAVVRAAREGGLTVVEAETPSLEEIFVARAGARPTKMED